MEKKMKVLCYTDGSDNTKGLLIAIDGNVDFSKCSLGEKNKWMDTLNDVLVKTFEVEANDNIEEVWEVSNALVHGQCGYLGDYEFYFEEVPMANNEKLYLDEENFPDANFRAALAEILDIDEDDEITEETIQRTDMLDVSHSRISNLNGIEHFTALTLLDCDNNQLTALDVSKNTALKYLSCSNNQLTALDVSKNTALTYLSCGYNQLTLLNVSGSTALTELHCGGNNLTSLDVSKNTALIQLSCDDNQLTALDVSKNTALKYLSCSNNQLTALDVSKNTALKYLYCDNNQLSSLDVSKDTALKVLHCQDNQLTILDVLRSVRLVRLQG